MTRRRRQSIISTVLLLASVVLFAAVGVLYFRDRSESSDPPVPTPQPGRNELIHVVEALRAEGLTIEILLGPESARSEELDMAGQALRINEAATLYVFIFRPDAAARADATDGLEAADLFLENASGDPIDDPSMRLITGSNVAAALIGAPDDVATKVETAITSLP